MRPYLCYTFILSYRLLEFNVFLLPKFNTIPACTILSFCLIYSTVNVNRIAIWAWRAVCDLGLQTIQEHDYAFTKNICNPAKYAHHRIACRPYVCRVAHKSSNLHL